MNPKDFFTEEEEKRIVQAVTEAEKNTSGEIRVHIDKECDGDVLNVATKRFLKLKMDKTAQRNGVLFYLSINDNKFAILGDKGINEKVPDNFWDSIKNTVISHFKKKEFDLGLINGITLTGEKLKHHFPYQTDDENELDDELSFGNK